MSPKRFIACLFLAAFAALAVVSSAPAGNFDEEKMGCAGENPATCPAGTVGQPYNMEIWLLPREAGTRGEDFGCATFHFQGNYPPGLAASDEGYITGTPTTAGTYDFFLVVKYDKPGCFKPASDDRFIIEIKPAVPKLTIGPESAPSGTVGTAYSLQMTANLPDAKTWSVAGGQLPPGVNLDAGSGLISGTPTTAGAYTFTVQAAINPQRTDTKTLTVNVRDPLTITASDLFDETRTARTEVSVLFDESISTRGGLPPYKATQSGTLPPGVSFDPMAGSLRGQPTQHGRYSFTIAVADSEGRSTTYAGTIVVARRLEVVTRRLARGKVGRAYRSKLTSAGGVAPVAWRVKRGPLPKGIRFNKATGTFIGVPARAGTWVVAVEARDALGVKALADVVIVIAPSLAKKKR